jgi:hypothetical protein
MFKKYTPDNFDKHHYLKAPVGFYFLLLVLLRPYIIWIMSVANRANGTVLIEFMYPNKDDFIIGLTTGVGALVVGLFFSLRRDKAYDWLPRFWRLSQWLLLVSVVADMLLLFWVIKNSHYGFKPQHAGVFLALLACGGYLFRSTRLRDFFADWPEDVLKGYKLPDEPPEEPPEV